MKKFTCTMMLILTCVAFSNAQGNPEYKAKLKKMFEVSGSEKSYKVAIEQMFTMFKQQKTTVPDSIWQQFQGEFLKTSLDDLVNMLEPVYSKSLSQDDLQQLIAFYQTPIGVKYAAKTPAIMQESMQVGQQWGMKIANEFQEKLKAKGY
ncbi:DUF2059 domain-containing protein [Dyadobacter chenwenxiniae]|uniref:DUF2059 domain-containing protein n=1 Tax=Dyadobacter chenwenxiniae TaxID=2906456 RepID=A0A9X1PR60_9BACT|nr:DUF2059 domain-containing protein [Dyadobacter chenwenxiniae]MCF0063471.1 DUF2059 domain-containing protein [Dyadobacter chenwenxiniae]UON85150.1 DUF2059 domain-containing protein [Dyadobacter chenwenxiniae]